MHHRSRKARDWLCEITASMAGLPLIVAHSPPTSLIPATPVLDPDQGAPPEHGVNCDQRNELPDVC
jgi:hypothetical protein